jgi:hypothetical protein
MTKRILIIAALCILLCGSLVAQAPSQSGQSPSTKGVVIKDKAPVSSEILKVKLPKPQEADLANGIHLMVRRPCPLVTAQISFRALEAFERLVSRRRRPHGTMSEGTTTRVLRRLLQSRGNGVVHRRRLDVGEIAACR